jgi:restriction system protein
MDISFHYPPELVALLIDTLPLLCRSKQDTLLFFKGAGVAGSLTSDLSTTVRNNRASITKFQIVRTVLTRLNENGESTLRERREVLKRVVEFDDFSTCWDSDRLKAQGLVAQIQKVVNVKDSFTRMKDERERDRQQSIAKREADIRAQQQRKSEIDQVKTDLFALFGAVDPKKRGKLLEGVLNRLFKVYGISVREAFVVVGDNDEGVIEQIDGVIELDGHLYFVEMKWWKAPVGVPEIAQHMMRVFVRAEARAIIISASEFTEPAIASCKEALSQKVVTLCTLQEFVLLLERRADLAEFLRRKVQTTIMDKNPFPRISPPQ